MMRTELALYMDVQTSDLCLIFSASLLPAGLCALDYFGTLDIIEIEVDLSCGVQFFDRQRLYTTIFNPTRLANGEGATLGTVIFDIELVRIQS